MRVILGNSCAGVIAFSNFILGKRVALICRLAEPLWRAAASPQFPRRRIYDARLALTLRHHGVTEFATANVKDFEGFGFTRVWNPLAA